MYEAGVGVPRDEKQAFEWYGKAGDLGIGAAFTHRGLMYAEGRGVQAKDDRAAAVCFRMAANLDDAAGEYRLGRACAEGRGVPQDDRLAAFWFRKAALHDDSAAAHQLGLLYASGHGVEQNAEFAAFWYQVAARLGNTEAMQALSDAYRSGKGVERDEHQADAWRQKAEAAKK